MKEDVSAHRHIVMPGGHKPEREGPMSKLVNAARRFLRDEDGPTAVEYAVMLALIIVVCITAIQTLGTNSNNTFSYVGAAIGGASS
jgi:pilus assembly protein Flp/PilA